MQPALRVCVSQILAQKVISPTPGVLVGGHRSSPQEARQMGCRIDNNLELGRVSVASDPRLGLPHDWTKTPTRNESAKIGFHYCLFYRIFIIFWWLLPRRSPLRSVGLSSTPLARL
jgi:hypothetical protein